MGLGKLVLRATLGGYFFGHGMQKLAGWFGGGGPERTGEMFEQAGLRPGRESALLAGAAEAGGGPGRDPRRTGRARGRRAGALLPRRGTRDPASRSGRDCAGHGSRRRRAVYVAEHGQDLLEALDADEALSRATEKVGAQS